MVALDVGPLEAPDFAEEHLDREQVLTRYRRLRAISRHYNSQVIKRVPRKAVLAWGKRLGIARGKTFVTKVAEEIALAFDLAVYAPRQGGMAPVERYRRLEAFSAKVGFTRSQARFRELRRALEARPI